MKSSKWERRRSPHWHKVKRDGVKVWTHDGFDEMLTFDWAAVGRFFNDFAEQVAKGVSVWAKVWEPIVCTLQSPPRQSDYTLVPPLPYIEVTGPVQAPAISLPLPLQGATSMSTPAADETAEVRTLFMAPGEMQSQWLGDRPFILIEVDMERGVPEILVGGGLPSGQEGVEVAAGLLQAVVDTFTQGEAEHHELYDIGDADLTRADRVFDAMGLDEQGRD